MKRYSLKKRAIVIGFAMGLGLVSNFAYSATLFVDDFESGSLAPKNNGYGWNGSNWGNDDAKPTVSTDIAHSGNSSLKFTFGGGPVGDDAFSELRYILGERRNEAYIQWYQYFPDGSEGLGPKWNHRRDSPHNNKFLKLWADVYGGGHSVSTGVSTHAGDNGVSRPFPVYGTSATNGTDRWGEPYSTQFIDDSLKGKWVKFQFHIKTATSANNDGVIQMWIDDKLVMDSQTVPLYPAGGVDNFLRNGYIMGWSNSGFDQTSYTYIDDFQISDTYIGGNPPSAPSAN